MTQDEAFNILTTGASVFLTGEPGSGKSHTVNRYARWLRERGIEPSVTASTGIAATHIGGMTIHSWSGIGIKKRLSSYELDQIAQNEKVAKRLSAAKVLIIDEVSMLSADTLTGVEAICREVRRNDLPFGGLQVLLVGDFFQLPPVERDDERAHRATDDYEEASLDLYSGETSAPKKLSRFAFDSPAWSTLTPLVCYLHEQHRQEDAAFLSILTTLRTGAFGEAERALLRKRYSPHPKGDITQLYTHNADVDRINAIALHKLPGDLHTFAMHGRGPERMQETLKRGCLSPESLELKVGARVMFTKNDLANGKYVNGTLGEVESFAGEAGYPVIRTKAGKHITATPDEWQIADQGKVLAKIEQLPLRLAWAITVHKSQGMSLDAAHMDLSRTFEYGQGYVALSRVRTLGGLSLAGLNERAVQVSPEVAAKDAEFRARSEAATEVFEKLAPEELMAAQNSFIARVGGHEPRALQEIDESDWEEKPKRVTGVSRWRTTHALLAEGKSLAEAAAELGIKEETIIDHLESLWYEGELDLVPLAHLAEECTADLDALAKMFKKKKTGFLKPVVEAMPNTTYLDARLARLFGGIELPPKKAKT